jgi:hypothetical protein
MDPALSSRPAVDPVFCDEFEHEIRCGAREVDQAPSALRSEAALEIVRIELESWDHLATVAPSGTPSRLRSLDERDLGPRFCGVVGGRETREASADHTELDRSIS